MSECRYATRNFGGLWNQGTSINISSKNTRKGGPGRKHFGKFSPGYSQTVVDKFLCRPWIAGLQRKLRTRSGTQTKGRSKAKYKSNRDTTRNIALCSLLPVPHYLNRIAGFIFNVLPSKVFAMRLLQSEYCLTSKIRCS